MYLVHLRQKTKPFCRNKCYKNVTIWLHCLSVWMEWVSSFIKTAGCRNHSPHSTVESHVLAYYIDVGQGLLSLSMFFFVWVFNPKCSNPSNQLYLHRWKLEVWNSCAKTFEIRTAAAAAFLPFWIKTIQNFKFSYLSWIILQKDTLYNIWPIFQIWPIFYNIHAAKVS